MGAPETVPAGKMDRKASNLRNVGLLANSSKQIESLPRLVIPQHTADLTCQVYNVTELFDLHKVVNINGLGLANSIDIVSGKVDKHDVLRSVLVRGKKSGTKDGVLYNTMSAYTSNRLKKWTYPPRSSLV